LSATLEVARQIKGQVVGVKSQMNSLITSYFALDEKSWQLVQKESYKLIDTLILVTQAFRESFRRTKREEKLLDSPI
jgi:ATP-dependent helicase/nuclease subunit A